MYEGIFGWSALKRTSEFSEKYKLFPFFLTICYFLSDYVLLEIQNLNLFKTMLYKKNISMCMFCVCACERMFCVYYTMSC